MDLTKEFEVELSEVFDDEPTTEMDKAIQIAKDRLIERISGYVCRIADQKKWKHKESVNLSFFE